MTVNARSGHGTIVAMETPAGSNIYVDIAELNDVALPGLSRNEFDATTQNEDIDSYVLGVLRRDAVTVNVNFLTTNATHEETTGLVASIRQNVARGFRFTVPAVDTDNDTWVWICSGRVQQVNVTAPVDGKLDGAINIRLSGRFMINGTIFG